MKETRVEIEAHLAERKARLKEMEERGVEALSTYDRTIAFSGNDDMAIKTSMQLVRSHISYFERQLAALLPDQAKLF